MSPSEAQVYDPGLEASGERADMIASSTAEAPKTQIIAIYGKGGIGKSFTLSNLSYMMAQQGKKVLLINGASCSNLNIMSLSGLIITAVCSIVFRNIVLRHWQVTTRGRIGSVAG